jgi:hypothetical protein
MKIVLYAVYEQVVVVVMNCRGGLPNLVASWDTLITPN